MIAGLGASICFGFLGCTVELPAIFEPVPLNECRGAVVSTEPPTRVGTSGLASNWDIAGMDGAFCAVFHGHKPPKGMHIWVDGSHHYLKVNDDPGVVETIRILRKDETLLRVNSQQAPMYRDGL